MTREERENAIRCLKMWIEREPQLQTYRTSLEALEQEPCEDAVSRQAVKDKYKESLVSKLKDDDRGIDLSEYAEEPYKAFCEFMDSIPPVTPKQKWIPVSERLPKPFSYVNCTCHSLVDDREDWVVDAFYLPQPPDSPYSDWGNIPMLNWGECEVIAWMYRDIPEPYTAESEDKE